MDQDTLFDQLTTMTKAYSYDAIKEDYERVKAENVSLKKEVEAWRDIALKYRALIREHETSIQEFLKK